MWASTKNTLMLSMTLMALLPAYAFQLESEFEFTQRNAYRIKGNEEVAQNKQIASFEIGGSPSYSSSFTVVGRASYDHYYDQSRFAQSNVDQHKSEADIREAYIDYFYDNFTVRLGKQQVTWGESDYFRVVDLVNSMDLRDFLLPYAENFQEARNNLNMLNIMHQGETWETQLLYIPDFQEDTLPEHTADFSPYQLQSLINQAGEPNIIQPDANLENAAWGITNKAVFDWGDIGLYGYSGWNGEGTLSFTLNGPVMTHYRREFVGASVSLPIGAFVIRSDLSQRINEKLTADLNSNLPFSEHDISQVLLGMDYSHASVTISVQFVHEKIQDYKEQVLDPEESNSFSFYASQDLMGDRLKISYLLLGEINDFNGLNEGRVIYQFTDQLIGTLGFDWFTGNQLSNYGQFQDQSRIFSGLKYFF